MCILDPFPFLERLSFIMEVPGMDVVKKADDHTTSVAAFVEGAYDDGCSICLEAFRDSDPSTVTICKHEFHLQCILEWCQRSSNCPMCWQPISLKDPASQELLEAIERERCFRFTPSRNARIIHHPTLGDYELQHLPVEVNDPELEDQIIQHLAMAAATRRSHRISRREGSRNRPSAHTHQHFVMFSANPDASSTGPVSAGLAPGREETASAARAVTGPPLPPMSSSVLANDNSRASEPSMPYLDMAGPSEVQSFSDTWRSRLSTMSMKYRESISKSTRGWTERLFSRSSSMADIGSEVRREVNSGIATVSRMMEHLDNRDNNRDGQVLPEKNLMNSSVTGLSNHNNRDTPNATPSNSNNAASFAASSV